MGVKYGLLVSGKDVTYKSLKSKRSGKYFYRKRMKLIGNLGHYIEELRDLYGSLNIVRIVKSRRQLWAGYVSTMGKTKTYRIYFGNLLENVHFEYRERVESLTLRWL